METKTRMNIVLNFETTELESNEEGWESRVIGTVLDALSEEGVHPAEIAVVAL